MGDLNCLGSVLVRALPLVKVHLTLVRCTLLGPCQESYHLPNSLETHLFLSWVSGRGFTDKVDRLKLAEIVKQVIEEQTTSHESQ